MALNGLFCADVPLRNYSLTYSLTVRLLDTAFVSAYRYRLLPVTM